MILLNSVQHPSEIYILIVLIMIPPTPLKKKNEYEIENKLEVASSKLFKWFHENDMKANQDKCHFLSTLDITTKI